MEIQRLELTLTEQDLNDLARMQFGDDPPIEDLEIRVRPDGVLVKGVYQVFVPVSFEALWALGVDRGRATARLANFKTMGMPGNVLKSIIMDVVADAAKRETWLEVVSDSVRADLDGFLKKEGLNAQTRLKALTCKDGVIIVEAGL